MGVKKTNNQRKSLRFSYKGGFDLLSFIRSLSIKQRRFIFKKGMACIIKNCRKVQRSNNILSMFSCFFDMRRTEISSFYLRHNKIYRTRVLIDWTSILISPSYISKIFIFGLFDLKKDKSLLKKDLQIDGSIFCFLILKVEIFECFSQKYYLFLVEQVTIYKSEKGKLKKSININDL